MLFFMGDISFLTLSIINIIILLSNKLFFGSLEWHRVNGGGGNWIITDNVVILINKVIFVDKIPN